MLIIIYIVNNIILYLFLIIKTIIIVKFLNYWYKVISIDISEASHILCNNENKQFVVVGYGHTSMYDTPFYCSAGLKLKNIKGLAKEKYKWMYPFFMKPYLHFIKNNTTSVSFDSNIMILCEGTRSKRSKLHSGYYYIAKNNNYEIIFFVIDFKHNKIRMSHSITNNVELQDSIKPLLELNNKYNNHDISYYPECLSDITIHNDSKHVPQTQA